MTRSRIGCERIGTRWRCHTAADLLALLGGEDDVATPIDCDADVVVALLDHLEARGVHLAPGGGDDLLHVVAGILTTTERRAVRHLRRELHAALLARDAQPPAAETAATERS